MPYGFGKRRAILAIATGLAVAAVALAGCRSDARALDAAGSEVCDAYARNAAALEEAPLARTAGRLESLPRAEPAEPAATAGKPAGEPDPPSSSPGGPEGFLAPLERSGEGVPATSRPACAGRSSTT